MKKLMIALAAVTMVAVAHAASVTWNSSISLMDMNFTEVEGTVAFYMTSDLSTPLADSPLTISGGVATGSVTGTDQESWTARITITNFDEGGSFIYDYVFTMDTVNHAGSPDADTYLAALSGEVGDALTLNGGLDLTASATAQGYTAAVPEPTSGLLILLGMAGLALKRKRA